MTSKPMSDAELLNKCLDEYDALRAEVERLRAAHHAHVSNTVMCPICEYAPGQQTAALNTVVEIAREYAKSGADARLSQAIAELDRE